MNTDNTLPGIDDIKKASKRIASYIHHTPVFTSKSINKMVNAQLYFKCENFQKVGAFKFRGATNAVLSLSKSLAEKGVATHSSGNHAAALALAARQRNIPSYIVMPENSPEIKKRAVAGYGGLITFCEPTLEARETTLLKIVNETGASFIHPYNRFEIIAGQGTASLELLEEYPELEIVMAPVGGGGLLSGTAIASKSVQSSMKVYGAEPMGADDAFQSYYKRELIPSRNPVTLADGLLTSLGNLTFKAILENVDGIYRVSEKGIVNAMRMIWERMKIIVEPSAAVPLAVVIEHPEYFENKKTGIILSGGNLDLGRLPF